MGVDGHQTSIYMLVCFRSIKKEKRKNPSKTWKERGSFPKIGTGKKKSRAACM